MNCADLRDRLPELAYQTLPAEQQAVIAIHLRECPDCRRTLEELRHVRCLLDATAAPPVRVDVAGVYRAAAADEARRLKRWRRLALAACAAAAALLVVVVGRLEFRVEAHQFVVRWKAPPGPTAPEITPVLPVASPCPTPEEWRVANALLQALVDDAKMRDVQQQDVARLRRQMEEFQRLTARRWASAENDIRALYVAHFSTGKGANP
jgi:hypothetical protein